MEEVSWLRFILASTLVLGLIGAFAFLLRKYGNRLPQFANPANRRLQVVETLVVGPRQRLMIIRCDGTEHLVLSGAEHTQVITTLPKGESNVGS